MAPATTPVRRILVIAPAQLGDVLICTPLIRAAREQWPEASIDVLGFAGTMHLLAGNPDVSQCIEIAKSGGAKAQLRQALSLWKHYDIGFVTRNNDRSHLYGLITSRLRSSIVPRGGPGTRWKRWITQHAHAPEPGTHQVIEKLMLVSPWRALPQRVEVLPPPAKPLPDDVVAQLRHPRVVVQVPSMWRYKQWPTAHYRRVVEALLADGVQVVLTGSGSPNDLSLVAEVSSAGKAPDLIDVAGRIDLRQVRTLLEGSDAYLGPDTSVTHLAATTGVPIVTVFGPSLPDAFGPWPRGHAPTQPWQRRAQRQRALDIVMLQGEDLPGTTCVPCNKMGCENRHDSGSHCLQTLPPERVLQELREALARRAAAVSHL